MLQVSIEKEVTGEREVIISVLKDTDFALSYMSYVVKRTPDSIDISFPGFLFGLKDTYTLSVSLYKDIVKYEFKGRKSLIVIQFIVNRGSHNSLINLSLEYSGPKERFLKKYFQNINDNYVEALERRSHYESQRQSAGKETHVNLGSISVVSKIVMRSRLISEEDVEIPKGGVNYVVGKLLEEAKKKGSEYSEYYLSMSSDQGSQVRFIVNGNGEVWSLYIRDMTGKIYQGEEAEAIVEEICGSFKISLHALLIPLAKIFQNAKIAQSNA